MSFFAVWCPFSCCGTPSVQSGKASYVLVLLLFIFAFVGLMIVMRVPEAQDSILESHKYFSEYSVYKVCREEPVAGTPVARDPELYFAGGRHDCVLEQEILSRLVASHTVILAVLALSSLCFPSVVQSTAPICLFFALLLFICSMAIPDYVFTHEISSFVATILAISGVVFTGVLQQRFAAQWNGSWSSVCGKCGSTTMIIFAFVLLVISLLGLTFASIPEFVANYLPDSMAGLTAFLKQLSTNQKTIFDNSSEGLRLQLYPFTFCLCSFVLIVLIAMTSLCATKTGTIFASMVTLLYFTVCSFGAAVVPALTQFNFDIPTLEDKFSDGDYNAFLHPALSAVFCVFMLVSLLTSISEKKPTTPGSSVFAAYLLLDKTEKPLPTDETESLLEGNSHNGISRPKVFAYLFSLTTILPMMYVLLCCGIQLNPMELFQLPASLPNLDQARNFYFFAICITLIWISSWIRLLCAWCVKEDDEELMVQEPERHDVDHDDDEAVQY